MNEISEQALATLFTGARTCSAFADTPVSVEQLNEIYRIAAFGPTTMNTQPMRVAFVRSAEAKERLMPHVFEPNQPKVGSAPVTAIVAAYRHFPELMGETFPVRPDAAERFSDPTFRDKTAVTQTWLQVGYLIMAVRAVGLAAGPLLGFNPEGVDAEFFSGEPLQTVTLLNIGVPAGPPPYERLPRLDAERVTRFL